MNALYFVPLLICSSLGLAAILATRRSTGNPKPKPQAPKPPGPFLRLTSPNGSEGWSCITQQQITWASWKIKSNVDLLLLIKTKVGPGVFKYTEVGYIAKDIPIGAGAGSYLWKVGDYLGKSYPPPSAGPGDYKIRIKVVSGTYADESDGAFTILPYPELVLTTPKGGTWQPENKLNISWKARYFPPGTTVKLELYKNLSYHEDLAKDIPVENEQYTWDISGTPGIEGWFGYHIRIVTMQTFWDYYFWKEFTDFSKEPFYILGYDMISLPTIYEGKIPYKKSWGYWLRDDPSALTDPDWYHNYADGFSDLNVQKLMNDIGCPEGVPTTDKEIWDRIGILWNWLKTPGHIIEDASELEKINPSVWPSISEYAKYYKDHGRLVWGTCGAKAQLFANLLIQLRVPQSNFVIATAHHNIGVDPLISMHEYIAIYLNGRWFYVDPLASQAAPEAKEFPDLKHACSLGVDNFIPKIDYEHPYHIDPPPECSNTVLFNKVAPYLPK